MPAPSSDSTSPCVYLLATLDTKAAEATYLQRRLAELGVATCLVDVGGLSTAPVAPDVEREAVYQAAGFVLADLVAAADRGRMVAAAAAGAAKLVAGAYAAGRVSGVLAIGGSAGTTIGTAAMRALPLGVPKLMVSTLASGDVGRFVGEKDILMMNTVVDLAGVNRISRQVLDQAARAMAGLVSLPRETASVDDRPCVAATMFGVTTPCVQHARGVLEAAGYEVLVFHATGSGGRTMEALITEGLFAGVLDLTTTELADELVGGFLSAGPERLTAAARLGVPQVVSVGATDMVNFLDPRACPARFAGRRFYPHNAHVTLMRTTREECEQIGRDIGQKLSAAREPATIYFPCRGVSAIDQAGQPFDDPAARAAMLTALRQAGPALDIRPLDLHINDAGFAAAARPCG